MFKAGDQGTVSRGGYAGLPACSSGARLVAVARPRALPIGPGPCGRSSRRTSGSDEFGDEVALLEPILDGAGILYVVDASSHLEPSNEAEMEILRWTGQPAMALINRVRRRDHAAEWRPTLTQFFHIVREFDAHGAMFRRSGGAVAWLS